MIGEGPSARSITLALPRFTLVGATTRSGMLSSPLRDASASCNAGVLSVDDWRDRDALGPAHRSRIEAGRRRGIARRARGTPRIANRLLRRVRDFAEVKAQGIVTRTVADQALNLLKVDVEGFDSMDRRLLESIIDKFGGGPVGIDSLAAAISEERDTIEDVLEPFLIQHVFDRVTLLADRGGQ